MFVDLITTWWVKNIDNWQLLYCFLGRRILRYYANSYVYMCVCVCVVCVCVCVCVVRKLLFTYIEYMYTSFVQNREYVLQWHTYGTI
jgi:hypothetical protein